MGSFRYRSSWKRTLLSVGLGIPIGTLGLMAFERGSFPWVLCAFLIGLVAGIVATLVMILVHEFGHLLAGKLVGMEIFGFCCGPFRWLKRTGKWVFEWNDSLKVGGFVLAAPRSTEFQRWPYFWLYLGGPLASLVLFLVAYVAFRALPQVEAVTIPILALSAVFLINFLPIRSRGQGSDGSWLVMLLARPDEAERGLATVRLFNLSQQDVPASEWPESIVASLRRVQGQTVEAASARLYELSHALAIGDSERCIQIADDLERMSEKGQLVDMTGRLLPAIMIDIALVKARIQRDATAARSFVEKAGAVPKEFDWVKHEVMACIFAIEGDQTQCLTETNAALDAAYVVMKDRPRTFEAVKRRMEAITPSET